MLILISGFSNSYINHKLIMLILLNFKTPYVDINQSYHQFQPCLKGNFKTPYVDINHVLIP